MTMMCNLVCKQNKLFCITHASIIHEIILKLKKKCQLNLIYMDKMIKKNTNVPHGK